MSCFFSSWVIDCRFYALWQNKLGENVKISFNVFAGFFKKKMFFFQDVWSIFNAPALWTECSEPFCGKIRNGCQTKFLRVQKINFLVKRLKYPQMFIFLVLTAKNSLRKLFWQTCQKWTCFVHSNILRKTSSLNVCFFFRGFECKLFALCKSKSARLSKFPFACPEDQFSR